MAKKKDGNVTITADTKKFNAELAEASQSVSNLKSELKLNKAQMENTGQSAEMLSKRNELLQAQYDALENKIAPLNGKLEEAKNQYGENSKECNKLAREINDVRTQQERISAEMSKNTQAIERQNRAQEDAGTAYQKLSSEIKEQKSRVSELERQYASAVIQFGKDSHEAKDLEKSLSQLGSELKQNEKQMNEAQQAARQLGSGLEEAEKASKDMKNSLAELSAGAAIGNFASGMVQSLADLDAATEENRSNMIRLENAYSFSGRSVDEARGVYQNFLGILGDSDQAVEAAQDMNNLADAGADFDTWYSIAAGTASAFGDALPVENLIESANETIRTGQVTGGLADALNWTSVNAEILNTRLGSDHPEAMAAFNAAINEGLSTEDAMNEALSACSDEQERQQMLTAVLASQYTELGDGYLALNEDIDASRKANDDLLQAQSKLAEKVTPLKTKLTSLAADGIAFVADNLNWLVPIVIAAASAIGVFALAANITTISATFVSGIEKMRTALAVMTGPIGIVVTVIGALVAGLMWAYNNVEPFRQAVDELAETLGSALGPVIEQIGAAFSSFINDALVWLGQVITTYVVPMLQQFGAFLTTTVFPLLAQFADWFTANIIPAVVSLCQWFQMNVVPILQQFWTFLQENIFPLLAQFALWIGETVVPALASLFSWFAENILPILSSFWSFLQEYVFPVFGMIADFIFNTVVPALASLFSWFASNILPILSEFWGFVQANILPIFQSIASFILGTVVPALSDLWSFVSSNILPIFASIGDAIGTAISAFSNFASSVGKFIGNAKKTVDDGLNAIKNFFGGLEIKFPEIKLPHFTIEGEFSIVPPSMPRIGVEWYAKGGIMTQPTLFGFNGTNAMIGGEAGHEAVLPIENLRSYIADELERASDAPLLERIANAIERLDAGLAKKIADNTPDSFLSGDRALRSAMNRAVTRGGRL